MGAAVILAPPKESGRTALETPAARRTAHTQDNTPEATKRQRLPAFGRRLRAALDAGYRPRKGGGSVMVTSHWDFARAFDPARVVCPPGEPVDDYDFTFLRGLEILVLVPKADELHGKALCTAIRNAGATLVHLAVHRWGEP